MERNIRFNWQALVTKIKSRRKELNMTLDELCVLANVSKPTLIKIERGNTGVSVEKLMAVLEQIGMLEDDANKMLP